MLKFSDGFGVRAGATERWEEEPNGCDKEECESEGDGDDFGDP